MGGFMPQLTMNVSMSRTGKLNLTVGRMNPVLNPLMGFYQPPLNHLGGMMHMRGTQHQRRCALNCKCMIITGEIELKRYGVSRTKG